MVLWNSLSSDLQQAESLNVFSHQLNSSYSLLINNLYFQFDGIHVKQSFGFDYCILIIDIILVILMLDI